MDMPITELIRAQPADHSLQQGLYNSPDAFARDMRRIFGRYWVLAGHAAAAPAPGDWFTHELADESVIIVRGHDHLLRAFANVCRHRGSRLCRASAGHAKSLACPYHAWVYDLEGRLAAARLMPPDFDRAVHGLHKVPLEVVEGLVFVSFAEQPLSMGKAAAAITAALRPYGWAEARIAHCETYQIAANWKLTVENYLECYHCTPSHPEFSALHVLEKPPERVAHLNAAMEARTQALGIEIGTVDHRDGPAAGEQPIRSFRYAMYDGVSTGSEGGVPVAPLMGSFTGYDGGVTSFHFPPSSFFIAYADHGVLYRMLPRTPAQSEMEVIWLVRGDAREGVDYDLEKLTWLWRVTTEADKRITEDNQLGVNSRFYRPGPYSPMERNAIAWMRWYLQEIA